MQEPFQMPVEKDATASVQPLMETQKDKGKETAAGEEAAAEESADEGTGEPAGEEAAAEGTEEPAGEEAVAEGTGEPAGEEAVGEEPQGVLVSEQYLVEPGFIEEPEAFEEPIGTTIAERHEVYQQVESVSEQQEAVSEQVQEEVIDEIVFPEDQELPGMPPSP